MTNIVFGDLTLKQRASLNDEFIIWDSTESNPNLALKRTARIIPIAGITQELLANSAVTENKVAPGAISASKINTTNSPLNNQFLQWTAAGMRWATAGGINAGQIFTHISNSLVEGPGITLRRDTVNSTITIVRNSLTNDDIPDIDAAKIVTGLIDSERLAPGGDAGQYLRRTRLGMEWADVSQSAVGTFTDLRDTPNEIKAKQFVRGNLDGTALTQGNLEASDIPNLDAGKITTGVFSVSLIPNLDANKLTSGILSVDRIPVLTDNKIPNLNASKTTAGIFAPERIPNLDAGKITSGTFTADRIPGLAANKINSGVFDINRIPTLNASKIAGGQFTIDLIPDLGAGKITSGVFAEARIPVLTERKIPNLSADKITSGTFAGARIPSLAADKITSGVFAPTRLATGGSNGQFLKRTTNGTEWSTIQVNAGATTLGGLTDVELTSPVDGQILSYNGSDWVNANPPSGVTSLMGLVDTRITNPTNDQVLRYDLRLGDWVNTNLVLAASEIPDLDASKITTGVFNVARIPTLSADRIVGGQFATSLIPNLDAGKITSGTFTVDRIPNLDAAKITSGEFPVARIPNISANKVVGGVFAVGQIPNLSANKIDSGTFTVDRIPNLDAAKITSGEFNAARIPDLNANKITAGTLDPDRLPDIPEDKITEVNTDTLRGTAINNNLIPDLDASKITGGTFDEARIPALTAAKIPDLDASKITSGIFNSARLAAGGTSGQYLRLTNAGAEWGTLPALSTTLEALSDVNIPSPNNNDTLTYDSASSMWIAEGRIDRLDELTDVDIPDTVEAGQTLVSDGSNFVTRDYITRLTQMTDVSNAAPELGQFFRWNGTQWAGDTATLNQLENVEINNPQENDIFIFGPENSWINSPASDLSLSHFGDVTFTNLTANDILLYNGTVFVNAPQIETIAQMRDVQAGSPAQDDVLAWNEETRTWNSRTIPFPRLGNLLDTRIVAPRHNQLVVYSQPPGQPQGFWINSDQIERVTQLIDTEIENLMTNQVLQWQGTEWQNDFVDLDELGDVAISGPAARHFLTWTDPGWANRLLEADDIPDLNASKITGGTFVPDRIASGSSAEAFIRVNSTNDGFEFVTEDLGASVTIQDTAPTGAEEGDLWLNSTNFGLFAYYTDDDGSQWVSIVGAEGPQGPQGDIGPQGSRGPIGPASTVPGPKGDKGDKGDPTRLMISDTAPASPVAGDLWFNSTSLTLLTWYVDDDGGQWVAVVGSQGIQGPEGPRGGSFTVWTGTQAEFDALVNRDTTNTMYLIRRA